MQEMKRVVIFLLALFPYWGYGQFLDNFNDGDFTSNPTWSGDVADFTINATNQLQLNSAIAGASYLSSPNTISLSGAVEWTFYVKQTFAASSSNFSRVYLVSDQANLEGALNGYYLQFGEAGTADAVELFKQTGLVSTSVVRGTAAQIAASFAVGIKVTRDATGLWTLYVDPAGGTNYVQEGNASDASFTSTAFFGISTTYTVSNSTKFFYDDFSINTTLLVDTTPPNLVTINVVSSNQLNLFFDEAVDSSSAKDSTHFFVNNGIGQALSSFRDNSNFNLVHVSFSTAFTSGILDTLFVDSIQDISANLLVADTGTFTYTSIVLPAYKDIVINEIMADQTPVVGLPNAEFVEIYNRGTTAFNLNQWSFTNSLSASPANLGNYVLMPDSFLILCSTSTLSLFSAYNNVIGIASFPSLVNTGTSLFLKSNTGSLIDSVTYSDAWYQNITKAQGGWTLELINPSMNPNCAVASNWLASNNAAGGTPGTQNSIFSTAPDVTAPSILSVTVLNSNQVNVCFSEAIDISQIGVTTNYSITNGIGNPSAVSVYNSNSCVSLTVSSNFITQQQNTITFSGLADCSGNLLNPNSSNFTYFAPVVASPKDVIINEIYSSPSSSSLLPNVEFIELYNRSNAILNLNNWSFHDDITVVSSNIGNYILKPDSFVVICSSSSVGLFSGISNVLGISSFPSLNNTGDHIYLRNELALIIDSVPYDDSWYRDALKAQGGWTLEIINPDQNLNCAPAANWMASTNFSGGTPGQVNSVYSNAPDITAPSIINVFAVDSMHVSICFSEGIDASQILVPTHYNINGGIGNPVGLVASNGLSCVNLTLATSLQSQQTYTLTLATLGDCSGNLVSPNTATFTYYTPFDAYPKGLIITEIYSSPTSTSGLPNTEYLELYNRTNKPINLAGWGIHDNETTLTSNIAANYYLFPDSFVIVCGINDVALFLPNSNVLGISSFPSLNNTGDHIYLRNALTTVIDEVNYSDTWYRNNTKKAGGWSLELIDPDFTCNNKLNWIASTHPNGGTPGKPNSVNGVFEDTQAPSLLRAIVTSSASVKLIFDEPVNHSALVDISTYSFDNGIVLPPSTQFFVNADSTAVNIALPIAMTLKTIYTVSVNANIRDCSGNPISALNSAQFGLWEEPDSGDVIINEILYNPATGGTDYVEIYNASTKVIDLSQLILSSKDTLTNELKSIYTIAPGDETYMLLPGKYLLLSENTDAVKAQYFSENLQGFWQMPSIPSFNISDGTVVLSTPQQKIIDDLHYYDSWQFPLLVSTKGVSLERINFARKTQDASNWHSASQNVGYGTPAYKNSQYSENTGSANDQVEIEPEVFSPDNDGYQDVVNITYKTDNPGYTGSITIYDERGRLIRNLVKNELWGNSGTYSWDGITNDRDKARIGIYVFLVEVFDLSGNTKQFKKVCVLGAKL